MKLLGDKPLTQAERNRRYRLAHPDRMKYFKRKWEKDNPEKHKEGNKRRNAKYRAGHREQIKLAYKNWKDKDPEAARKQVCQRHLKRMKTDPTYKLIYQLRYRLWSALKVKGKRRVYSQTEHLGCTPQELKNYLESKFKKGMSWSNYGRGGWAVDHIFPLSKADLSDKEQFKKVVHHSNLQPLWWSENSIKNNKILN